MRKTSLKSAERKLLKVIGDYIRQRDNYTCYTCGKQDHDPRRMNAGHLFSRRHKSIKYDESNIHAQCSYCNKWLSGNLHEYIRRFRSQYGDAAYEQLYAAKDTKVKYKVEDLQRLATEYEHKLTELK